MPQTKGQRFERFALSIALVSSFLISGLVTSPGFCQSKETDEGVTVQKNADGTVDAYDAGDAAQADDGGGGSETYTQQGDGRIHYRPGTSPYEKKYSDGTTVRRNSDGSIETWDGGETQHWSEGGTPSSSRKRTVKRSSKATHSKTTSSVKKKSK